MRNKNAKKIISSYRKKQKTGPYIVGGIAILLAIAGIILLVVYLPVAAVAAFRSSKPKHPPQPRPQRPHR